MVGVGMVGLGVIIGSRKVISLLEADVVSPRFLRFRRC